MMLNTILGWASHMFTFYAYLCECTLVAMPCHRSCKVGEWQKPYPNILWRPPQATIYGYQLLELICSIEFSAQVGENIVGQSSNSHVIFMLAMSLNLELCSSNLRLAQVIKNQTNLSKYARSLKNPREDYLIMRYIYAYCSWFCVRHVFQLLGFFLLEPG